MKNSKKKFISQIKMNRCQPKDDTDKAFMTMHPEVKSNTHIYKYIHVHTHMDTHMHTHIHTWTHTYTFTETYTIHTKK